MEGLTRRDLEDRGFFTWDEAKQIWLHVAMNDEAGRAIAANGIEVRIEAHELPASAS